MFEGNSQNSPMQQKILRSRTIFRYAETPVSTSILPLHEEEHMMPSEGQVQAAELLS